MDYNMQMRHGVQRVAPYSVKADMGEFENVEKG